VGRAGSAGLVAAAVRAADTHPQDTVGLAADLAPILNRARLLADGVIIASAAVHAADVLGSRSAAGAWGNLGLALQGVRRLDEAITAFSRTSRSAPNSATTTGRPRRC